MSIIFSEYNNAYRVVSIALDEKTRLDLSNDELDFIYFSKDKIILFPDNVELCSKESMDISNLHNFDVCELYEDGYLRKVFDICNSDNYFFVIGKCNSNCVMCPSSEYSRRNGTHSDISNLIEIAKHIPTSVKHLTITGGEPFLIGERIFDLLSFLKDKFEHTDFLILTNGRIFSIEKYAKKLAETMPRNCTVAIPVHASTSDIHDAVTQSSGSFIQTVSGIKRLLSLEVKTELRVVVSNINADYFDDLSKFIVKEFSGIAYVSIIAMEMTGNAAINKSRVWLSYKKAFGKISDSILYLLENEIDVKLYNFPLCTVEEKYRTLCEKSISSGKIRFADFCNDCRLKSACGGAFYATLPLITDELEAIK